MLLPCSIALFFASSFQHSPRTAPPPISCARVLEPGAGHVNDLDVSRDGTRVLIGCENGHAFVYEIASGKLCHDLTVGPGPVLDVEFDAKGERMLTLQYGQTRVWNAKTGEPVCKLSGQKLGMMYAHFSPDGARVATGSCGNSVQVEAPTEARVWDSASGEQVALVENTGFRVQLAFRPDGKALLVSSEGRPEWIIAMLDGSGESRRRTSAALGRIAATAWSPDGKTVAAVSTDMIGHLWDAQSGRERQSLRGHTGFLLACEFNPDGNEVSTTSWADQTTRVWNVQTGKCRLVLGGHTQRPTAAHFAPNGRTIASIDAAGHGFLFELEHGNAVGSLSGHTDLGSALAFTPDSKSILTGSFDGTVRVWTNPLAK